MPHLPTIDGQPPHPDVERVLADLRRTLGITFVPNFFRTLAHSPTVVEGTWSVYRNVGWRGTVPTVVKEMIFVAISAARACRYCEAAHLAFCTLLGGDATTRAALAENLDALQPRRTRDIVKFAVKAAMEPASVTAADYEGLRQQGLSTEEIVEVIAMAAFAMYATTIADALQLPVDREFTDILAGAGDRP